MSFFAKVPGCVVVTMLTMPWLVPPAMGPSPAIVSILLAWAAAGAFVLIANLAEDLRNRAIDISAGWLQAALISGVFALFQYFDAASIQPWISPAQAGEAYGNLRQRNQFATLCNIGLSVLLFKSFLNKSVWPLQARGSVIASLLLMTASAASGSRTGLAQLLMLLTMLAWWHGLTCTLRNPVARAALSGYVLAALSFAVLGAWQHTGGGIWSRVHEVAPACSSRWVLWSNVLHLIQLKPWTGWGWGELSFAHFTTLYPGERFCDILDNAHNLPLHLAVELGVPAAVAVCGVVLWWIVRRAPWRETDPVRRMAWAVLALLGLHSMLEYPLWYGPFQLALLLCLWMLWSRPNPVAPSGEASNWPEVRKWQAWVAMVLIAIVAWVGWSYWRVSQLYLPPDARAHEYRVDTLTKVQDSWLFQNQVQFAALTTTPLTRDNAEQQHAMALKLLHFSPEPSVVQRVIESAVMLGRDDEALYYLQRFKAAFPQAHAQWAAQ